MTKNLQQLIAEAGEKFDKEIGGLILKDSQCGDMLHYDLAMWIPIKNHFYGALTRIASETAKALEVGKRPKCKGRECYKADITCAVNDGYNSAIAIMKQKSREFLADKK